MSHFLFATMPVPGHVAPLAPVAEALVARGHEVTWYTSAVYADAVRRTGATHRTLVSAPDYGDGDYDRHFPERRRYRGLRQVVYDFEHLFARPAEGMVADLRAVVGDVRPDVLVTDTAVIAGAVLDEVDSLPTAMVNITVLALPSVGLAPFGLGLGPSSSPLGRVRNRLLTLLVDRVIFRRPNRAYREIATRHGWPVLPIKPRSPRWLFLQPSVPSLEYPRPDLPDQVHYVGALLPRPHGEVPPEWQAAIAEAKTAGRKVVLVTQGTVATDPDNLIRPALQALAAEEDLLVLVAGADLDGVAPVPANARVAKFVPFGPLMESVDAFVTNGGFGGLMTALAAGVPVVTAGTTEDKAEVGGRVARSGVGINLRTDRPAPDTVRGAVRAVLTDTSYREAADSVRQDLATHDGPTEAAELLERLAVTREPVLRTVPSAI